VLRGWVSAPVFFIFKNLLHWKVEKLQNYLKKLQKYSENPKIFRKCFRKSNYKILNFFLDFPDFLKHFWEFSEVFPTFLQSFLDHQAPKGQEKISEFQENPKIIQKFQEKNSKSKGFKKQVKILHLASLFLDFHSIIRTPSKKIKYLFLSFHTMPLHLPISNYWITGLPHKKDPFSC
jgi:hypothetical protein